MDDNRYTFSIEKPEELSPPPKKRRSRAAIIALVLVGAMFFSALGGVSGIYLADHFRPGTSDGNTPVSEQDNQNPPSASTPNSNSTDKLASITTPDNGQLTVTQVFNKCNPAVVAIATETTTNVFGQSVSQAAAGSGFIISSSGYVVTNNHVISGASSITVMLYDGKEYTAKLIGSDKATDLAVLKIEGTGFTYLDLGDSSKLVVGEQVVAIGNPLGELANSLSVGYISALARTINIDGDPMVMLQTDASVSPGNSGGPLINLYGQVIGIVSAKSTGSGVEGIGFAIPMNTAIDVINSLIDNGYVTGRPYFGISVQYFSGNTAAYYNISDGLYVMSVEAGSCAEKAGLKVGDRIISLGGTAINSTSDLQTAKLTFRAGATAALVVSRNGQELTLSVTFDEEKPAPDSNSGSNPSGGNSQTPWGNTYPWGGGMTPWGSDNGSGT